MLLSRHISTPAKYYTCTSIRVYLSFNERTHEWLVFFLTVLLTDGPEGAEENVTHQQSDFHDASSNLNWSIPLKHQTPSVISEGCDQLISQNCGLWEWTYSLRGGHTEKQNKTKQNENKNTHPIKTVDDLKRNTNLVALGIWIRF